MYDERLVDRLNTIPGVEAASVASNVPLGGAAQRAIELDGRPNAADTPAPQVSVVQVGERYLDTLGVSTLQGRGLTNADGQPGSEAVVVNTRFAARFLEGEEVVGRRIRLDVDADEPGPWMTIVGISPTIRQSGVEQTEPDAVVYRMMRLEPSASLSLLLSTDGSPTGLLPQVREAVQSIDQDLPIFQANTLTNVLAEAFWPYQVFGTMFAIFALVALVLSSVGIYAVTAYSINQRTQEIGLRMALGAGPNQVVWMVMRRGLVQLVLGLSIGLVGAAGVGQILQGLLVQISPTDTVTLVMILLVLSTVTVLACLGPARRAALLDPSDALRVD